MRETTLVAARELRAAFRSRWFLLAGGAFFVLSLAVSFLGLAGAERSGMAGFDRTTAGLLHITLLVALLVALLMGALGIAEELEDGTLGALLAQPVTRAEVFLGKLAGLWVSFAISVLAGFGASGVVVGALAGGGNVSAFLAMVGLTLLLGAAALGLGSLLSVLLRSRSRVVAAAFGAWIVLVAVSDLGTIGLVVARNLGPGQTFALALANPLQQARVLGTLALSDRLDVLGPVAIYGVDLLGRGGLVALLIGALLALASGAAAAGYALFRKAVIT